MENRNDAVMTFDQLKILASVLREMIKHENDWINNRITWMLTIEAFLVTSASYLWDRAKSPWPILLVGATGIVMSISIWAALARGNRAISKLQREWDAANKLLPLAELKSIGPIIGLGQNEMNSVPLCILPWNFLPILFIVVWLIITSYFMGLLPKLTAVMAITPK